MEVVRLALAMKSRMPDPYRSKPAFRKRDRTRRKSSPVANALKLVAVSSVGGAIMLASLAGIAFLRSGSQFMEGVKTAIAPRPPEDTADVRSVVVERVRTASELTTAVFTMEAVVPAKSDRKLGDFTVGETNLLYIAYGEVSAGVDLSKIQPADVSASDEETTIRLVLPAPEIFNDNLDVDRSDVYDYDRGFLSLGPDRAPELQKLAMQEAKRKIKVAACEQDILKQANDRAQLVVGQLLKGAGFNDVVVETSGDSVADCYALI